MATFNRGEGAFMPNCACGIWLVGVVLLSTALPAAAADLPAPSAPPSFEALAHDWSGVYVGGNVGYTYGTSAATYDNSLLAAFAISSNPAGWSIGLGLGANQELANGLVLGVDGDINYGSITSTIPDTLAAALLRPGNTITSNTDWSGSIRGKVGFAAGQLLPYLTAGLAVANASVSATDGPVSQSAILAGWTAGAGLEYAIDENWSAKAEYLYTDLGTHTWFSGQVYSSTSHSTSSTVRVGLNYKF
jgi:outer membrane immunogenic protein